MRCNNCGFNNETGTHCAKCNAPLSGTDFPEHELDQLSGMDSGGFKKTIPGQQVNELPWDCPNCSYPVVKGTVTCPKCGYLFSEKKVKEDKSGDLVDDGISNLKKKNKGFKETIDPYQKGCVLKPVATKFESEMEEIRIKATGDEIEVGRNLLEPDNGTISSSQASLIIHNGKWYIKDKSSNNSTFVLASDYTELNDEDVILMGDRKFIFSTK